MNRVHEQCLKIDSGTVLSQTGPKTGRVHQVHSPQPSGTPRRAQARAHGRIVALPPSAVSQPGPAVSWPGPTVSQCACARPCELCGRLRGRRPCAPRPAPLRAVSQAQRPYRDQVSRAPVPCRGPKQPCLKTLPSWPGSSICHDTKPGLTIQFPTSLAASVTIQTLYRDTALFPANCLQYKTFLQYNS